MISMLGLTSGLTNPGSVRRFTDERLNGTVDATRASPILITDIIDFAEAMSGKYKR